MDLINMGFTYVPLLSDLVTGNPHLSFKWILNQLNVQCVTLRRKSHTPKEGSSNYNLLLCAFNLVTW